MHKSVLVKEVIEFLHIQNNERFVDATLGAGGHTLEILKSGGQVLGIEADSKMLERTSKIIGETEHKEKATLVLGNFRNIGEIANRHGFSEVDGILFDLGISSLHLDNDERGFSFNNPNALLDMRLNSDVQGVMASDLLNSLNISQLTELLKSRKLAQKVMDFRAVRPFSIVGDFLTLFENKSKGKIHPATKAFMELRIAVNSELDNLSEALPQAFELLKNNGRLAVISFHSGEDTIVKKFFKSKKLEKVAELEELVVPTAQEIEDNARSRSAKLRGLIKCNEKN